MEKAHILNVLKETKKAIHNKDVIKLKALSNQTIHSASVEQEEFSIAIAVIVYSLGKIIENYQKYPDWEIFLKQSIVQIEKATRFLEKDNINKFKENILAIEKLIDKFTGNFKTHIQQVFEKAKINKASRIYEHGISMEKTANLLGITVFELAEYAGKTGISDVNLSITLPIEKRIKYVNDIFK
ncbi:MAG: hypothetical protein N3D20_00805 [Candidatus Pacearchaeota archaeon]|nr:hypothetical protein [Candidatus Pacearchaeota archaeon]